jgi:hypothetical protein
MSEVTDFIAAVVAIAKDPKAWEKRLGDAEDIAKQVAEIRKTKKEADEAAKAAAADLETARYERGQAERASRDMDARNAANQVRERDLRGEEKQLTTQKQTFALEQANARANLDAREADLQAREAIAAKKLNDANKLMAAYDEAKHQAALKLAS